MKDDRLQVLRMIETGKISAEEGMRLLEACECGPQQPRSGWVRIRVWQLSTGKSRANVNLPLNLIETGLRFIPGGSLKLESVGEVDVQGLLEMIKAGRIGKLLDVTSEEEDVRVEIYVD